MFRNRFNAGVTPTRRVFRIFSELSSETSFKTAPEGSIKSDFRRSLCQFAFNLLNDRVFPAPLQVPLNVLHGTRIATKTQNVATGTAHKLNLNESAENSQRASGAARMARNALNDHCEFKIGLKRTIGPRESIFSSNGRTTMHHTPTSARKLSADRPPIAV
jgi:hypothetical protein